MAKKDRKKDAAKTPNNSVVSGLRRAGPTWLTSLSSEQGLGRWLLITSALLVLLAILYPDAVFNGQVFLSSDSNNSASFAAIGDASRADGHYPLWNPYLFAGMPTFGSTSYVPFLYPPSIVFNFLQQELGFVPLTWLLGHMLFGGLGMAWLLTRWRLPTILLIFGAAIWLLGPKVIAWGVHGHGSKLGAAMYLPWLVGWVLQILDGRGIRAVGMVGLLLGLLLLRGHPQITYYSLLVVGWLALFSTIWPLNEIARNLSVAIRWRRFTLVVLGLGLGFLIGGILLVPQHDYAAISIRGQDVEGGGGVGLDYATAWSLAPSELSTFVAPAAVGFGKATYLGLMPFNDYPNYFGFLLLLLAVVAWWRGSRALVVAMAIVGVLSVCVAFGNFGFGLYEFMYRFLPFFNKFRIPSMILILLVFVVAMLAPMGVAAWRDGRFPWGRPFLLPTILGTIGIVSLLGGALGLAQDNHIAFLTKLTTDAGRPAPQVLLDAAWELHKTFLVRGGLILLAAGAAFWFSVKNKGFRRRGLPVMILVLVVIDLLGVNRGIIHPERSLLEVGRDSSGQGRLMPATKLVQRPPKQQNTSGTVAGKHVAKLAGNERVWVPGPASQSNNWMADGVRSLSGYHPAKLAQYEQIRKRIYTPPFAGHLISWLSGATVVLDNELSSNDLRVLQTLGVGLDPLPLSRQPVWVYKNLSALPRARLVTDWALVESLPEKDALEPFLDGIQAGDIEIRNRVYLSEAPDPLPEATAAPLPQPIFVTDGLDEVVLEVETPVPALLLLADMMVPGWQVEVDGVSQALLTADLVLRSVALSEGKHTVRFYYQDSSVRAGLTLTLVGAFAVLLLLGWSLLRRGDKNTDD